MRTVRVYLKTDIEIGDNANIAEELERILREGEPFVGDGGLEITDHEIMDTWDECSECGYEVAECMCGVEDAEPIQPKKSKYAKYSLEDLEDMADTYGVQWEPCTEPAIARMRLILALRQEGVIE